MIMAYIMVSRKKHDTLLLFIQTHIMVSKKKHETRPLLINAYHGVKEGT